MYLYQKQLVRDKSSTYAITLYKEKNSLRTKLTKGILTIDYSRNL